jgi:pimeloyl-ACP methyl ester carboxylesterase
MQNDRESISIMTRHGLKKLRWFVLPFILSACSTMTRPDLPRLYQQSREVDQPPVILLHGIMGSRLEDAASGEEVWFGSLSRLVFSDYREVALEIDPVSLDPMPSTLAPSGLADQLAGKDFYGNITRTLERAGRYERALPGEAQEPGSRSYYVFLYDWRQDNAKSAQQLYRFIEQIRKDYSNPQLEVDLIAHSMGGLIARYFLRYGKTDVLRDNTFEVNLDGADRVRRVILLGTPNLGSMSSLHAFIKGKKIGFGRLPPEVLASMPSVYQTFPHALNDWIITTRGKPLNRDLFDVRIWRRFQWSIFDPKVSQRIIEQSVSPQAGREYLEVLEAYFEIQLERGRRFVWSLTVPLPEDSYKLIVFGGDCLLTPARLLVEEVRGVSEVRLWPHEISNPLPGVDYDSLMLEPGDGIVTKASLLARESLDSSVTRHRYIDFPLDYPLFLCEKHDALTGNETFQDNLLHALLSLEPSR